MKKRQNFGGISLSHTVSASKLRTLTPYGKRDQRLRLPDVFMFPQERCESLGQGSKSVTGRSTEQRA
jgi:hypothetical protein